jgi:hypothetical protein
MTQDKLNTTLTVAINLRNTEGVKELLKMGADPNGNNHLPLRLACNDSIDKGIIEALVQAGATLDDTDLESLKMLAAMGHPNNFQTILELWPGSLNKLEALIQDPELELTCLQKALEAAKEIRGMALKTRLTPKTKPEPMEI